MSIADRCASLPVTPRRVVALVVVPLVLALLIAVLLLPFAATSDSQARWRDEARQLLADARHAPAEQAALEREIAALKSSQLWSKFYSTGGAVSSATALHADVSAVLGAAQASVQSVTPLQSQELEGFTKVGARFTASMRLNQLQSVLTGLAGHTRYLRVERLIVVAPQVQSPQENPPLAVTMEVHGYELPGQAAGASEPSSALAMSRGGD
jgi:hypothetical protein